MGEGFKKQKRKFLRTAIIYSAVCGVSFGLFAFGTVFLALKLAGIPLHAGIYVLIAIAPALLVFGLMFLLLKPNDKRIAYELDKKHGFNEKVQTALAYQSVDGEVVEIQRADIDARLLNLPKEKFDFKKVWQYILIAVLSIAVFVSSLFVPSKVVAEGDDGTGINPSAQFVFTESQMLALQELIENVKASPLANEQKEEVVDSLNKLMNNLMFAEVNSEMIDYVNATVQSIESTLKLPLSYKAIANALGSVGLNDLAKMIADGVQVYKEHVIVEYSDVESFYDVKLTLVSEKIEETLTEFFDLLADDEKVEGEEDDNTLSIVEITFTNIYLALNLSSVDDSDNLRTVLFDFAKGLAQNDHKLTNDTAINFDIKFNGELSEQAYLLAMNKYVNNRIREIFGLNIPADETFTPTYLQDSDGNKGGGDTQGGYGKGDMLYGSDDAVYDPSTGEYVKYGEIFNYYYAIVESLLREGKLTEEQQAVIRAYLEILLSGIKE